VDENGRILDYIPLILVDFLPVTDVEELLSLSPEKVEYLDIVNSTYIRGDNIYGGILSIRTKAGDRAGLGIPEGSMFINFSTFHVDAHEESPKNGNLNENRRIPDLRTTLYWDPHRIPIADAPSEFEFYTSDLAGEFTVWITGITKEGFLLEGSCSFQVR
jgi:hypothetical protein